MSGSSSFAHTSASDSEAADAASAAQKSVIEWSELVGFRRREAPAKQPAAQAESASKAVVVVGKGASILGEISNCSQVEIAGALEGKIIADTVLVREGGVLKGQVRAERAEVHGTIEGQIEIEDHLDIHATGEVSGELTYGKLSVASGGRLAGSIAIITASKERAAAEEPSRSNGVHGAAETFAASSFA